MARQQRLQPRGRGRGPDSEPRADLQQILHPDQRDHYPAGILGAGGLLAGFGEN